MPDVTGRIDIGAWMTDNAPPASSSAKAACVKSSPPVKRQKLEVKVEVKQEEKVEVKQEEPDDFGAVQEVVEQTELDNL